MYLLLLNPSVQTAGPLQQVKVPLPLLPYDVITSLALPHLRHTLISFHPLVSNSYNIDMEFQELSIRVPLSIESVFEFMA